MTGTIRILIIHEDEDEIRLLREGLTDTVAIRYRIAVARTGAEGLEQCSATSQQRPDCAIVGLHLPDMTGLDFLGRLKRDAGEIATPVMLFIDSGADCQAAASALRSGAQDYIARSWLTPDGLACSVENTIERFQLRQRLRAETAALDRQGRELRSLLENVPSLIARFDRELRIVDINTAFQVVTGVSADRCLGKTSREAGFPAVAADRLGDCLRAALQTGTTQTLDLELENHAENATRTYAVRVVPQSAAVGTRDRVLAVFTDVSESKRTEDAIRASKQHLRDVMDCLITFVGVLSPEGILLEANLPARAAASLQPEDVLGRALEDTYWWSYSPPIQAELRHAVEHAAAGESVQYEAVIRTGADQLVPIDFRITPLRDAAGRVTHLVASAVDISARKSTEEALRQTTAREQTRTQELQAVLRATPAVILVSHDTECQTVTGNSIAYRVLGQPEGSNLSALESGAAPGRHSPEERDRSPIRLGQRPLYLAARMGIECAGAEMIVRLEDGTERRLLGNTTPLREPDQTIQGAIGVFVDITNYKAAQAAVYASEERFRLATQAVNGMIYDCNPETGHVDRSEGLLELIGVHPDEARPTTEWWLSRVHPEDQARARARIEAPASQPSGVHEWEYRVLHADGRYRNVLDRSLVVFSPEGRPERLVGSVIDITDRVRNEESLRLSQRRFLRFATSDIIGILIGNLSGTIQYANDEFLRILGATREALEQRGFLWLDHTPQEWHEADQRGLAEARSTGSCQPYEKEFLRPDGTRIAVLVGYTLLDELGDELVAFVLDQTERKKTLRALQEADRKKDEFLAMLAHELRNPLAAIRTAAQILLLKGPLEPEVAWSREVIERQARHLTRLIEDLLDVSRIGAGKLELRPMSIDLRGVVLRAIEAVRPLIDEKAHTVLVGLGNDELTAVADPVKIEQVLTNLITNAAKYTDDKGRIEIRARKIADAIELCVLDNGLGIDPEVLPHIFDLYTQAAGTRSRSVGGLGIGLTLVRMLVELHGGTVAASSQGLGRGSEFVVQLPAAPTLSSVPHLADNLPVSSLPIRSLDTGPRILLVDHNVERASRLSTLASRYGYNVKTAHDRTAALQTAREFRPELVFVELDTPGLNGREFAAQVRRIPELRQTRLIAISSHGRDQDHASDGFNALLVKPIRLAALRHLLTLNRA